MCYKIVHGLVSILFESFFEFSLQQNTRGHALKLFYPDSRVGERAHKFSCASNLSMARLPFPTVLAENTHCVLLYILIIALF